MHPSMEFAQRFSQAYSAQCKPLCLELNLPQTAFDILMFLGNNPSCKTARDIVEVRHIKANLVSINVERLVQEGYLERRAIQHDRRKTELICTPRAQGIILRGRQLQERFFEKLFLNVDEAQKDAFIQTIQIMSQNLDGILKGEN